eukprot:1080080_1
MIYIYIYIDMMSHAHCNSSKTVYKYPCTTTQNSKQHDTNTFNRTLVNLFVVTDYSILLRSCFSLAFYSFDSIPFAHLIIKMTCQLHHVLNHVSNPSTRAISDLCIVIKTL